MRICNSISGHRLYDDAPEWTNTLDVLGRELRRTVKAVQKGNGHKKEQAQQAQVSHQGFSYVDRTKADCTTVTSVEDD